MGVALNMVLQVLTQSAMLVGCVALSALPNVEVVDCNVRFVDVAVLPAPMPVSRLARPCEETDRP